MSWTPLLSGADAEMARASIGELLEELPSHPLVDPWAPLLYVYADRADNSARHRALIDSNVDAATTKLAEDVYPAGLYGGFSGVAWLVTHLEALEGSEGGATEDIDHTLRDELMRSTWIGGYDLISGIVGIGVYFLERLRSPSGQRMAKECLGLIVDRLGELASHTTSGCTWLTQPHHGDPSLRDEMPNGYYNLGMAHGIPGVIALLGQICGAEVGRAEARDLLRAAVSWLLAQPVTPGLSRFPTWQTPDATGSDGNVRLAWCYGNLGIATALMGAARHASQPEWEPIALALVRNEARRDWSNAAAVDTGLCHGTSGIAHLFNRFFQATGEAGFADAARYWFRKTLELRRPGHPIAGYQRHLPAGTTGSQWAGVPRLLDGAVGVGLSLLAAVSTVEPRWDSLLLANLNKKT